jgi:hypothetical protein
VLTTLQNKPRAEKDLTFSDYFDVSDLSVEAKKNFKVFAKALITLAVVFAS